MSSLLRLPQCNLVTMEINKCVAVVSVSHILEAESHTHLSRDEMLLPWRSVIGCVWHKGEILRGWRTRAQACWGTIKVLQELEPGVHQTGGCPAQLFLKQKITQKTLQLHYSRSTAIFGQFSRCFAPCSCLWTEVVLTPAADSDCDVMPSCFIILVCNVPHEWHVSNRVYSSLLSPWPAVLSLWLADQPPAGMTQMALCCDANQCLRFWWCALIIISINSLLNKQKRLTLFNTFLHWLFLFCKIKTFNLSTSQLSSDKLLLWQCQKQHTAWHNLCRSARDVRIEINVLFSSEQLWNKLCLFNWI